MRELYMTLRDFVNHQHPGVRQNPYKYKIINIGEVFDKRTENMTLEEAKRTLARVYLDVKDFPEGLMDYRTRIRSKDWMFIFNNSYYLNRKVQRLVRKNVEPKLMGLGIKVQCKSY